MNGSVRLLLRPAGAGDEKKFRVRLDRGLAACSGVLDAVDALGGVYAFGTYLPIWAIVLIEFAFAFTLEMTMGSPCSFRLASKVFSPKTTHPVLFQPLIRTVFKLIFCKKKSLQPNSELSA